MPGSRPRNPRPPLQHQPPNLVQGRSQLSPQCSPVPLATALLAGYGRQLCPVLLLDCCQCRAEGCLLLRLGLASLLLGLGCCL